MLVLTASYTDEGANGVIPLTGSTSVALSSNTVSFPEGTETNGMQAMQFNGMDLQLLTGTSGWLVVKDIDLKGVQNIAIALGWQEAPKTGYIFELHLNSPDGPLVGAGEMKTPSAGTPGGMAMVQLSDAITDPVNLYVTYKVPAGGEPSQIALVNATFN